MRRLTRAAGAAWEFVVGDDPWTAVGVLVALVLTAVVARWWVLPPAVFLLLATSLRRAAR